jgi:hypothetical protein
MQAYELIPWFLSREAVERVGGHQILSGSLVHSQSQVIYCPRAHRAPRGMRCCGLPRLAPELWLPQPQTFQNSHHDADSGSDADQIGFEAFPLQSVIGTGLLHLWRAELGRPQKCPAPVSSRVPASRVRVQL